MGHQINYTPAGHLSLWRQVYLLVSQAAWPLLSSLLTTLSHLTAVGPWLITLLAWDPVSAPTLTSSLTLCPPIPSLWILFYSKSYCVFQYFWISLLLACSCTLMETSLFFFLTNLVIVYLWYREKHAFLGAGLPLVWHNLLLHSYLNNRKFC